MNGDALFTIFPLVSILFYLAPVVFIIWFLIKFLKLQQEKNKILKTISDKLDKLNTQTGEPVFSYVQVTGTMQVFTFLASLLKNQLNSRHWLFFYCIRYYQHK